MNDFSVDLHGAEDEITYWSGVFKRYAEKGDRGIETLLSSEMPLQAEFREVLESYRNPEQDTLRVLDVGCGPLSVIGKLADFKLNITGVDPLADQYKALLSEHGLRPPHESLAGMGETLHTLFEPETFDFVHSSNALDHCEDPRVSISNMVRLAKPGTKIFINVYQNEAENAAYSGFHRWNFDELNGKIVVWNPGNIDFLDFIVDGLPYSYRCYHFRGNKKHPDQFDIIIHKCDFGHAAFKEVGPDVKAMFSR
jgi:SAM-dependent methyltransferase